MHNRLPHLGALEIKKVALRVDMAYYFKLMVIANSHERMDCFGLSGLPQHFGGTSSGAFYAKDLLTVL